MNCIGIDIGSTSMKGAVLDLAQRSLRAPMSFPFPAPKLGLSTGWVEIDPNAVYEAVASLLAKLLTTAPEAENVFFSGQTGGLVLINQDGAAQSNYLSWRDQRTLEPNGSGEAYLDSVKARLETANHFEAIGRELAPGSPLALLAWLRQHNQLPVGVSPITIADYVVGRFVGAATPTHVTQAGGMLDLNRVDWRHGAFEHLGLNKVTLPTICQTERCVGSFSILGRKRTAYGSYGDQQCALRGAGLLRSELSLNIATGSQVSRRTERFQPGAYLTRRYFFGDYLNTVTHLPAGRSLNAIVSLLTELAREQGLELSDPWKTIHQKVSEVETTDLEFNLAFFQGPLGRSGRLDKITTENLSVGPLFHAAYKAMADNYSQVASWFLPMDWERVVLSGGLTQSTPRLRQLLEQRFDKPFRESSGEETLLGLMDIAISNVER